MDYSQLGKEAQVELLERRLAGLEVDHYQQVINEKVFATLVKRAQEPGKDEVIKSLEDAKQARVLLEEAIKEVQKMISALQTS